MRKRILSFLIVFMLIIGMLPTMAFAANTDFAGGSGIEGDPYLISTKEQLDLVRNDLDAYYKLTCDIEFAEADFAEGGDFYNEGQGFEPIGDATNPFIGSFDGDGHTIKNLYINISSEETNADVFVGLFGYNKGTIENLGMVESEISAAITGISFYYYYPGYAGSIAGYNEGTIENCYNTGAISATDGYDSYAGGIAGENGGTIQNCYNTGAVTSTSGDSSYAGGIAGYNNGTNSTIENCYNTGSITATGYRSYAGGIAGRNYNVTIKNCYNTGSITATGYYSSYAGGIAGRNDEGTIENCYYLNNISRGVENGTDTAVKCTAEEMMQQSTYVGFDFEAVWTFDQTLKFHLAPVLKEVKHVEEATENTIEFAGGIGTPFAPFLISNKAHLNNVRKYLGAHFKLTCDIEFTDADFAEGGDFYNNGQGFAPIGDSTNSFIGSFDGDGHTIKNLYVNIKKTDADVFVGLFGYNKGTIENLGMVESEISATSTDSDSYAGGIAGENDGTIQNCYNTGAVSSSSSSSFYSYSYAGGIAGYNYNGTIQECYNTGSITATGYYPYAGGIAGRNYSGTIRECYNTGAVTSTSGDSSYAGGIAGYNNEGTIKECYNTGAVTSTFRFCSYAGGIAGYSYGTIKECYNTGAVTSTSRFYSYAGGIAGYHYGTIKECYNTGAISATDGYDSHAGGIAGYNDYGTIQNCYYLNNISKGVGDGTDTAVKCTAEEMMQRSTYAGFDFESVWTMDGSACYPLAKLQNIEHSGHYFENDQDYLCDCGHLDSSKKFTDVPANAWYKEAVDYAVTNGIFSGTSATTFSPTKQMTRAQFVLVLANLSGVDTSNNNVVSGFSDVPTGQWYTAAVTWAAQNGIVSGVGDGKFNPTGVVTRQQMCVIIVNYIENYLGKTLNDAKDTPNFADDSAIANWAKDAVYKCADAGLINGIGNNQFAPKNSATRAQGTIIFKSVHQEYILK